MGAEGGRAILKKYGVSYFKELGRRGFASLVNRYFHGNREAATRWLHAHAAESHVARLLDEQSAANDGVQCTEIPVYLTPDDDPTFDESPSWQERVIAERNGRKPKSKS